MPTWQNTPETDPRECDDFRGERGFAAPGSGPANLSPPNVGFTGLHAFEFSGSQTGAGRGYADYKVFSVHLLVTKATQLSYYIDPVREPNEPSNPSTYAVVDLHFTDGTYLSALGAQDQSFVKLDARDMGASDTLYPDEWNQIVSRIGAVAAGKTIDRIIVDYGYPNGTANPNGPPIAYDDWVDDITITGNPAQSTSDPVQTTSAPPSDYVETRRGTNNFNALDSRGYTFLPATAVPNGFNFWAPDAGSYQYASQDADDTLDIAGFDCSHEANQYVFLGVGCFGLMPSPGAIGDAASSLPFSHADEIAKAHYYSVVFQDGLRTEITPTDHAAMFRFTFIGDTSTVTFAGVQVSVNPATGVVTGSTGSNVFLMRRLTRRSRLALAAPCSLTRPSTRL